MRYGRLCGWTLARSHARSGHAAAIAGYLGTGSALHGAVAEFARDYAERNNDDYAFVAAIDGGRLPAPSGV